MQSVIDYIFKYLQLIRVTDIIDILVVAVIVYYIIRIANETRARNLLKGIAIIFVAFFVSRWLNLTALNYIIGATLQVGAFAIVVIFQPELRNLLERMGRIKLGRLIDFTGGDETEDIDLTVQSVAKAAADMSATRTGALMVLERETKLGE